MSYTLYKPDGSILTILQDNKIDDTTTSLSLVGKNTDGYGQSINSNFIKLLANFASRTGSPPLNPIIGQLWYNTTNNSLRVYTQSGWSSITASATVSANIPNGITTGDLWLDITTGQIKTYFQGSIYVIGPQFPVANGDCGWVYPLLPIKDSSSLNRQVTVLKNYGNFLGILSNNAFDLSTSDSLTYFSTSTTSAVSGITLKGDISVTGQITNRYLSTYVDLDKFGIGTFSNVSYLPGYITQNVTITNILTQMFPISTSTVFRQQYNEVCVPNGSQARVVCGFTSPSTGTHVRRFFVRKNISGTSEWVPYELYSYNFSNNGSGSPITTSSNIIS
jgi:hypothetical protein